MDYAFLLRDYAKRPQYKGAADALNAAADEIEKQSRRMAWLQEQAEQGCVTMCFEMEGGVHVTLDPVGGGQRAARNVETVSEGIDQLMTPNT